MPEPRPIAELRQLHEDARTCLASLAIEGAHAKTLIDYYAAVARTFPALLDCAEALDALEIAERAYRAQHDLLGDDSPAAGRAWDSLRRAGDAARAAFATLATAGWRTEQ